MPTTLSASEPAFTAPTVTVQSPRPSWRRWRPDQQWEGYLFILPSLIGFFVFIILAVLFSLGISFSDWGLTGFRSWVGLENYRALFRDPIFWRALRNTGFYLITIVPSQLALGMAMALALNQSIRGQGFYRLVYFMPVVTTIVAGAIVFRLLFSTHGPVNGLIEGLAALFGLGVEMPNWLGSTRYAKWAVVFLTLWKNTGFTMVIYLAALQGVPRELYDAAHTDGANAWQRFRHVTLPMISPTTFFLFVFQAIGAFQLFTEPFVMTQGGPANASLSVVQYIYLAAFRDIRMDKASAMAWFLFIFIFIFTLIQNRMQRNWVYYEASD